MPSGSLIGDNRPSAFDLDDDQRVILDQADRFARKELYGLAERMDAEEWWPEDAFPKIGDNGLFGVTIPEEYGGAGLDLVSAGLVAAGLQPLEPCDGAGLGRARQSLRQQHLSQRQRGAAPQISARISAPARKIGALGLTEPGAGSDALGSMRTTARRDGDHYVLNGGKIYITNGPVADVLLVYAKTDTARRARTASPPSSSKRISPASRSRRSSRKWAIAAARPANSCSRIAACRLKILSARKIAASRS